MLDTHVQAVWDDVSNADPLSLYLHEVATVPLLTRDEEVALAARIELGRSALVELHAGSSPAQRRAAEAAWRDGQLAWDHLVKANSRLVISMAKRFRGQGVPFLDLIQEGNVGLMRAADKFDRNRGFKFSTYATWWVRQAITRAVANQGRTIRVPVHMSDRIRRVYAVAQAIEQQDGGRAPKPGDIARRLGLSEAMVRHALRVARRNLSLETPTGENRDIEMGQLIEDGDAPNPFNETACQLLQDDLDALLECLTAREARIVRMRFGLDDGHAHSLKEVGRKFNLTRERIRQIEQDALAKLRHPRRCARLASYLG